MEFTIRFGFAAIFALWNWFGTAYLEPRSAQARARVAREHEGSKSATPPSIEQRKRELRKWLDSHG